MKPVFADAFFYVACLNRGDQHHEKAIRFARQPLGRMVTTRLVLIEVADGLASSAARTKVAEFISALEHDPAVSIIELRPMLLERGLQLYHERPDKK